MSDKPLVLVIEDDPDQILMYQVEFESRGFDIKAANNGDEGIALARQLKPKAVLLDIHMEGKDGLQVLHELKTGEDTKSIPVMVFTNFSRTNFEEEAKKLGADKFVLKTERVPRQIADDIQELIGKGSVAVAEKTAPARPEKVLLIEDNPFHRQMYTTKFAIAGFTLLTASNGENGLKDVQEKKPDLVLLDLALPGISGVEVLKKLKADAATKDVPVVTFTVSQKEELPTEVRSYLEENTVAYFDKLTQLPNEAVALVEKLLNEKK